MKTTTKSRAHLVSSIAVSQTDTPVPLLGGGVRIRDKRVEIVFPHVPSPQVIVLGTWPGKEKLAEEIGDWLFANYRDKRAGTRHSGVFLIRQFMHWLDCWDSRDLFESSGDLTQDVLDAYLTYLQQNSRLSYAGRGMRWNIFSRCFIGIITVAKGPEAAAHIHTPNNPFPFMDRYRALTQPLTVEEVRLLVRYCSGQIDGVWNKYRVAGSGYDGMRTIDCFPFIYLAALFTAMNPDTIRDLQVSDLTEDGYGRLIIRGAKPRAGRSHQVTLTSCNDIELDGTKLFQRVIELTASLRNKADRDVSQDLWLVRSRLHGNVIASFRTMNDASFSEMNRGFSKACGIDGLTLRRVRTTVADLVRRLDTGVSASTLLGHSPAVAERHYKSAAAHNRQNAILAGQIELRNRYVQTKGRRDVRDNFGSTQGAATPGYTCADPFAPPGYLNQAEGMCAAFLECPTCPLAGVNIDSPHSISDLLGLRRALQEAQHKMSPARWREHYMPKYEQVNAVFDRVSAKTLDAARSVADIPLPVLE